MHFEDFVFISIIEQMFPQSANCIWWKYEDNCPCSPINFFGWRLHRCVLPWKWGRPRLCPDIGYMNLNGMPFQQDSVTCYILCQPTIEKFKWKTRIWPMLFGRHGHMNWRCGSSFWRCVCFNEPKTIQQLNDEIISILDDIEPSSSVIKIM